jgi:hypothetical protein
MILKWLLFFGYIAGGGVDCGRCELYFTRNRTPTTLPYATNSEPKCGVAEGILSTIIII